MLDFKLCENYKQAEMCEHCAFDKVCDLNCFFTNRIIREDYQKLQSDFAKLESEVFDYEDLEQELNQTEDERESLEYQKDDLVNLLNYIISICNKDQLTKINEELNNLDYDWYELKNNISNKLQSSE